MILPAGRCLYQDWIPGSELKKMNAVNQHIEAEQAIQAWFTGMSRSVKDRDIGGHLSLISDKLAVYGMPGKDVMDCREWQLRRRIDFDTGELLALHYRGIRIVNITLQRVSFVTTETLVGRDDILVTLDERLVLEKEADMQWRVVEITINRWDAREIGLASVSITG
jgi:hypothetical protein